MIPKGSIERKPLHQFSEEVDIKPKTALHRLCAAKIKLKAIRDDSMLWSSIPKRWVYSKTNQQVKKDHYNWIIQHPQVVYSPKPNDFLKLSIEGQTETRSVTIVLLHVSVRELHNSMVSSPKEGGLEEVRDSDNNVIMSDSTYYKCSNTDVGYTEQQLIKISKHKAYSRLIYL